MSVVSLAPRDLVTTALSLNGPTTSTAIVEHLLKDHPVTEPELLFAVFSLLSDSTLALSEDLCLLAGPNWPKLPALTQ